MYLFSTQLARIGVLAFLMYIRFGFVPRLEAAQGTAEYPAMERTANVLVILWEFLYTLGLDMLLTWITYNIYVWKRMTERATPGDFPFLLFVNGLLYISTFTMVIIQVVYSYNNLLFINIGLFIFVFFGFVTAIVLMVYSTKISRLIPDSGNNHTLALLKRMLTMAQIGGWVTALVLVFRCITVLIDTIAYQFIPDGTIGQVVWNIIFKYIFWVIPELIIVVFASSGFLKTDEFITELSIINIETSRGRTDRIQQLSEKERGIDVESLQKQDRERRERDSQNLGSSEYSSLPIQTEEIQVVGEQKINFLDVEPTLESQLKVSEIDDDDHHDSNAPLIQK